jgi:hypothetical protein
MDAWRLTGASRAPDSLRYDSPPGSDDSERGARARRRNGRSGRADPGGDVHRLLESGRRAVAASRQSADGRQSDPDDWRDVEIWLNAYFRVTVRSIPARSRFQVMLDSFVSGYGQRFNFSRMPITALRLSGKRPDGSPVEVQKEFLQGGLAGALGGKH